MSKSRFPKIGQALMALAIMVSVILGLGKMPKAMAQVPGQAVQAPPPPNDLPPIPGGPPTLSGTPPPPLPPSVYTPPAPSLLNYTPPPTTQTTTTTPATGQKDWYALGVATNMSWQATGNYATLSRYGLGMSLRLFPNARVTWANEFMLTIAGGINKDLDGDLPLGGALKSYLSISPGYEKIYDNKGNLIVDSEGKPVLRLMDFRIKIGAMLDSNRLFIAGQSEQRNPQGKVVTPATKASVDTRAVIKALFGIEYGIRFAQRKGLIPVGLAMGLGAGLGNGLIPTAFIADLNIVTSFNGTRGGSN